MKCTLMDNTRQVNNPVLQYSDPGARTGHPSLDHRRTMDPGLCLEEGKDGGTAALENAVRFPLSLPPGGR